jgi:hypothetical protein
MNAAYNRKKEVYSKRSENKVVFENIYRIYRFLDTMVFENAAKTFPGEWNSTECSV